MSRAELARRLGHAHRIVVFTGAGISTDSGIPDFRSPGGVWSRMQPITYQAFVSDPERRREAWARTFSGVAAWTGRRPNCGHAAVAELIARGRATAVITQNVDDLHQASGVPAAKVIELHGNASYARCLQCGARYELEDLRARYEDLSELPVCTRCGGLVKTATVSFGQAMPEAAMARAEAESLACDLFLVLGSSLTVYPAAGFPVLAKRNGAALVIVNREPTELDRYADLVLHDEIGPAMEEAMRALPPNPSGAGDHGRPGRQA